MSIRLRALRKHLRTAPDYALESNYQYFDREIQDRSNGATWVNDCARILVEVRAELHRRTSHLPITKGTWT